ncbi:hypothetical protein ACFL1H_01300 [Nanoarchaeota archaeon]
MVENSRSGPMVDGEGNLSYVEKRKGKPGKAPYSDEKSKEKIKRGKQRMMMVDPEELRESQKKLGMCADEDAFMSGDNNYFCIVNYHPEETIAIYEINPDRKLYGLQDMHIPFDNVTCPSMMLREIIRSHKSVDGGIMERLKLHNEAGGEVTSSVIKISELKGQENYKEKKANIKEIDYSEFEKLIDGYNEFQGCNTAVIACGPVQKHKPIKLANTTDYPFEMDDMIDLNRKTVVTIYTLDYIKKEKEEAIRRDRVGITMGTDGIYDIVVDAPEITKSLVGSCLEDLTKITGVKYQI